MIASLSQHITYGATYCAIEHADKADDARIHLLIGKKHKGELNVVRRETLKTIEEAAPHIPKRHVHLLVNNHHVLHKVIESHREDSIERLVNQAFPNIDLTVFYIQVITARTKAYIYICRKSYIDTLITTYENHNAYITGWSLGESAGIHILPFVKGKTSIQTSTGSIDVEGGQLIAIHPLAENRSSHTLTYDMEGIQIESSYVNALGALIVEYGQIDISASINSAETQEQMRSRFIQHRRFQLGLPISLSILLAIFLANFLCYNYYFKGVAALGEISEANTLQKQRLVKKDSLVKQKQKLFEDVIESASSSASLFVDEIIDEMPEAIRLDQFYYHPLRKKIRNNKPIEIEFNSLLISGITVENNHLSEWISRLEKRVFIEKVSIRNLDQKARYTHFELLLEIIRK